MRLLTGGGKISADRRLVMDLLSASVFLESKSHRYQSTSLSQCCLKSFSGIFIWRLLSSTTTWRGGIVVAGAPPCTPSLSDYRSKEPDYITRPKTKKNESRIFSESLSTQTDFHACLDIFTNHPNQEAGKASKKKIKQRFPLVPFFLCGQLYPLITLNMFINVHARGRADQRKISCLLTSTMAYAAK